MRVVIVHAPLKGAYISRHLFFAFFAAKNPDAAEADLEIPVNRCADSEMSGALIPA